MEQAFEDHLCPDEASQVVARLAALLAFALDLADRKPTADEVTEVDAANEDLASRIAGSRSDWCSSFSRAKASASIRVISHESGSSKLRSPSRPLPGCATAVSTSRGI